VNDRHHFAFLAMSQAISVLYKSIIGLRRERIIGLRRERPSGDPRSDRAAIRPLRRIGVPDPSVLPYRRDTPRRHGVGKVSSENPMRRRELLGLVSLLLPSAGAAERAKEDIARSA
jgi:hypothetical protein